MNTTQQTERKTIFTFTGYNGYANAADGFDTTTYPTATTLSIIPSCTCPTPTCPTGLK